MLPAFKGDDGFFGPVSALRPRRRMGAGSARCADFLGETERASTRGLPAAERCLVGASARSRSAGGAAPGAFACCVGASPSPPQAASVNVTRTTDRRYDFRGMGRGT